MRAIAVLLLLAVLGPSAGCIENMGDLKEALGAVEPASLPPDPTYLPPLARAQANVTSVLQGAPVRFTSEGTRDPQGLGLDLAWSFGDGASATGASAQHAFAQPGEYAVRLTATNDAGLSDVAALSIQVLALGKKPVACFAVTDERGAAPSAVEVGTKLVFDAACSSDPDAAPLSHEWTLGGAAVSHDARATHAFDRPGVHVVKLKVTDASGLSDESSREIAVGYVGEKTGSFDATGPASRAHEFPVAPALRKLEVTLTFPAGLGGNDLVLVVKDPDGDELGRSAESTAPGAQEAQVRVLTLGAEDLSRRPDGTWTVEVAKARGLMVDYTVQIRETY